MHKAIIIAILS